MQSMKRISSIIVMLILVAVSIPAQRTYALLAGVSNYGVDSINLHTTTKDVKQLKLVLDNQNVKSAVLTSKYANHNNIVNKLNGIIKLAKPNDNIIIYFSGHGTPGGFVPSDRSFFNYQELVDILKKAKAANIYCFIDACMSGSVKNISDNNFGIGKGNPQICFMTASSGIEISRESRIVGHGYFTKALLKGLRGMSDKNADKTVTLEELFNYIYNDVTYRTKSSDQTQHPQLFCLPSMRDDIIAKW